MKPARAETGGGDVVSGVGERRTFKRGERGETGGGASANTNELYIFARETDG